MKVTLQNPRFGEVKSLQLGWSWLSFCFAPLYGIPLFFKGLMLWGGIVLALSISSDLVDAMAPDDSDAALYANVGLLVEWIVIGVIFGLKANELAGKNYLEKGWVFFEPNSPATAAAKARWKIMPLAAPEAANTTLVVGDTRASPNSAQPAPDRPISNSFELQNKTEVVAPTKVIAELETPERADRESAREKWAKEHPRLNLGIRLVFVSMLVFVLSFQLYKGYVGHSCEGRYSFMCKIGQSLAGSRSQSRDGQVSAVPAG